jgi:hypothetical protein
MSQKSQRRLIEHHAVIEQSLDVSEEEITLVLLRIYEGLKNQIHAQSSLSNKHFIQDCEQI